MTVYSLQGTMTGVQREEGTHTSHRLLALLLQAQTLIHLPHLAQQAFA